MNERYYAVQHIYLVTSHPPKVPYSLNDIHPFLVSLCAASLFFVGFKPVVIFMSNTKIWLRKAPGQDLTQNGSFPMVPEAEFSG